jgi:hypothetical protein
MENETRLDKSLRWIKNNKFFAAIMLASLVIVGISQLVASLATLVKSGREMVAPDKPTNGEQVSSVGLDPEWGRPFGTVVQKIGSAGIGPGHFDDARFGTATPSGELFVTEFENNGRVQRFDSQGQFVSQWFVEEGPRTKDITPTCIVVDMVGNLYMCNVHGQIVKFDAVTGRLIGKVEGPPGPKFAAEAYSVQLDPQGGLVSWWNSDEDSQLVWTDREGKFSRVVNDPLRTHFQFGDSDLVWPLMAVDGSGNIYVIGSGGTTVFKLSALGEYINRFGTQGREPGQFWSANAITVDGNGNVYVSDQERISRFDSNGRYLDAIALDGWPHSLALDLNGNLYAMLGDHIDKIRINR